MSVGFRRSHPASPQVRRELRRPRRGDSGQALVETVLVMPLSLFLVLGTLQLFMLTQARIMSQYAVMRAVRAGSLNQGDCNAMMHAAIASVLPSVTKVYDPANGTLYAQELVKRKNNQYQSGTFNGQIVEIVRESPRNGDARLSGGEDLDFDEPDPGDGSVPPHLTLEARMVFWYKMNIPFANWVISRMFLAHYGLQAYTAQNPLSPARPANWSADTGATLTHAGESWPGGDLATNMLNWSTGGNFLFPIQVNAAMRMMTPAKASNFTTDFCPLNPT